MPRRPLPSRRSNPAARMMMLRQWHTYIGAFIAPSVLFFALTGALQLFSLHEAHDGYTPPPLIEKLSAVHKDQEFKLSDHHGGGHAHSAAKSLNDGNADHQVAEHQNPGKPKTPDAPQIKIWVLKWIFLVVALGLVVSTLIGLWMAFITGKRKGVIFAVLAVGAALPVLLLAL